MTYELGLCCLLFTYGFILAYHLMSMIKYFNIKQFNWYKAGLGLLNESGYILFWYLIYIMPNYIDLTTIGINLDIAFMVNALMLYPLVQAINKAYGKAIELKDIKINNNESKQ